MLYTYRNVKTGVEFQSNCKVVGSNLIRLEPSTVEEEKPKEEVETKTPKKTVKRGTKK